MNESMLTKDARYLLSLVYNIYRSRVSERKSRRDASRFSGSEYFHRSYFRDCHPDDVTDWIWELSKQGFIDCGNYDNKPAFFTLKSETIAYFEQLPKERMLKFVSLAASVVPSFNVTSGTE